MTTQTPLTTEKGARLEPDALALKYSYREAFSVLADAAVHWKVSHGLTLQQASSWAVENCGVSALIVHELYEQCVDAPSVPDFCDWLADQIKRTAVFRARALTSENGLGDRND